MNLSQLGNGEKMECPTCHDANQYGGLGFIGIPTEAEFTERAQRLDPSQVEQWLGERAANAVRIGNQKTEPKDQAAWFEDAAFFVAARAMVLAAYERRE